MSELAAFPSLVIRAQGFVPSGAFAEAQAAYLDPDPAEVAELRRLLAAHEAGIVAHYYMDPELQGVLSACAWPHIHISDSLVMADRAVKMVEAGARRIVVLGVDFMSENVRAMLDAAGHAAVPVWRVAERPIGCSLAEAAESPSYAAYLERAAQTPRSLHVVYINTSLRTKAQAHARVPTITCTSSNVVQTVLQAFAQIPDATVWFGPDTYMGENLHSLFAHLGELDDAAIRRVHPAHDRARLARLRARFHHFEQGSCVVHHMFGASVVETVKRSYADCFVTAHLEVPGEMFALALAAAARDGGVVGSTSNILDFIGRKVDQRAASGGGGRLRFVLGTEAGMITAIARRVQATLRAAAEQTAADGLEVEIVFPVAAEAVVATGERELPVVPGVAGGEGCSPAGGCATCPYMKMNSLEALFDVLGRLDRPATLALFAPRVYRELVAGRSAAELGSEPILHMRAFQREGVLPAALVRDVVERHAPG